MNGADRREKILNIICQSAEPVSGSNLAKQLHVSRQVIVQDIALLRAENIDIMSTTKGYIILNGKKVCTRTFRVKHTDEQMEDELNTIVDQGAKVVNVIVEHPIYGDIKAELAISTRKDVQKFIQKVSTSETTPLKDLTNGVHKHEVEADNETILNEVERELKAKNYLIGV